MSESMTIKLMFQNRVRQADVGLMTADTQTSIEDPTLLRQDGCLASSR